MAKIPEECPECGEKMLLRETRPASKVYQCPNCAHVTITKTEV